MIKHWILTGDMHGGMATVTRLGNIARNMLDEQKIEETAVIILGDAGLNFYLNNTDKKYKKMINSMGICVYCVRGNHEERPENLGYDLDYDPEVKGLVYLDPNFENIKYLVDGEEYWFGDHSALVIGGAYSIDKRYRLARAGYMPEEAETADPKKCGWFKDEQLTAQEMSAISDNVNGKHFDFILSHTCPLSWEPTDLFLNGIDQSQVDKSMEIWMDDLKNKIDWRIWLFGHYHADRIERPYVEQMYMDYENINTIWNRWFDEKTYEKEWWLPKSPHMKWFDEIEEASR